MTPLRFSPAKLKENKAHEYISRFLFGGLVTVLASLVSLRYGPVIGGLFLAFPGIFPAGVSLTETHAKRRHAAQGKQGTLLGREEASVEAAGASAGALGLIAFAAVVWRLLPAHGLSLVLPTAFSAWLAVSTIAWAIREKL